MGDVWLATERAAPDLRGSVVVKVLKDEFAADRAMRSMFLHEARLGSYLVHPRIAQIRDFGEHNGTLFLVMEYVAGPALSTLIHRHEWELPLGSALQIVADTASALNYAHAARGPDGKSLTVVHRDVTPQNILISESGLVKLIDFGVAKSSAQDYQTQTGVLKGKLAYMAPEQFEGKVTAQTDIFALGVILHELVSRERLFKRPTEAQTFAAVLNEPIPAIKADPDVAAKVQPIVSRALARKAEYRYAKASDLEQDLRKAMYELGVSGEATALAALVAFVKEKRQRPVPVKADLTTSDSGFRLRGGSEDGFEDLAANDPFLAEVEPLPGEQTISDLREVPIGLGGQPKQVDLPSPSSSKAHPPRKRRVGIKMAFAAATFGALAGVGLALVGAFFGAGSDIETTELPQMVAPDDTEDPVEPTPPVVETEDPVEVADPTEPTEPTEPAETPTEVAAPTTPRTTTRRRRRTRPAPTTPAVAETGTGRLFLDTNPWSTVRLGQRNLGQTPIVNAEVPAGRSTLVLREGSGEVHRVPIRIQPNRATKRFIQLRR